MVAATPNPAVSTELLLEIMHWQREGATINDVCARLRQRTVPPGYSFHTRIAGIVYRNIRVYSPTYTRICKEFPS